MTITQLQKTHKYPLTMCTQWTFKEEKKRKERRTELAHRFFRDYAEFTLRDPPLCEFKRCIPSCHPSPQNHIHKCPSHLSLPLSVKFRAFNVRELRRLLGSAYFKHTPQKKWTSEIFYPIFYDPKMLYWLRCFQMHGRVKTSVNQGRIFNVRRWGHVRSLGPNQVTKEGGSGQSSAATFERNML